MPGPLITRQDIANGAVSAQPRKFDKVGGKSRAARVFFYFRTAMMPTSMPHALGRTPESFRVVSISNDSATGPGSVFKPINYEVPLVGGKTEADTAFCFTRNYVVLACTTANTWAEVEIT